MTDVGLQIGLNLENQLVSIYDVKTGVNCNCYCPECGAKLIAKNKNKNYNEPLMCGQKIAHFSHANGADCPNAKESAIHLLAKQVLSKRKRLLIPPVNKMFYEITKPKLFQFDNVYTEQIIVKDDIRIQPDSILEVNGRQLYVEFYKTHMVDDVKINKIKTLGVSCVEIDLNCIEPLKNGKLNVEDIVLLLEQDISSKRWIFNSQLNRLYKIFKTKRDIIKNNERLRLIQQNKEKHEKLQRIENWISNLKMLGYEFLKIYEFRHYDYYSNYNENTGRTKSYRSVDYIEEYLFCPKVKIKSNNKIDLDECDFCEYHKGIIYSNSISKSVVCGFKKGLKNNI